MAQRQNSGTAPATGRGARIIAGTALVGCALIFAVFFWLADYANRPGPEGPGEAVVLIPRGASFTAIASILADKGVIEEDIRFQLLALLHGKADRIRAGEFVLQRGVKPLEVLEQLDRAKVLQHPVTIAEGLQVEEIAAVFAAGGWCRQQEFLDVAGDADFLRALGLGDVDTLEGYLYPDTYYLTRIPAVDARKIISMMVGRFFEVWQSLDTGGADRHETVILASIVEKETADPAERPRIASVFRNRLDKGMRLQSDPTVIYGIVGFTGDITRKDLRRPTPYNTYVIKGLPAGPICNPGKEAMAAVLQPAAEGYLYFVSRNDGTHHFSKTLGEHNRAVNTYQRRKEK